MKTIRGVYDGRVIRPAVKVDAPENTEVVVIFPENQPEPCGAAQRVSPKKEGAVAGSDVVSKLRGFFRGVLSTTEEFMKKKKKEKEMEL